MMIASYPVEIVRTQNAKLTSYVALIGVDRSKTLHRRIWIDEGLVASPERGKHRISGIRPCALLKHIAAWIR